MVRTLGTFSLVLVAALLSAAPLHAGGWATITVIDLPHEAEVGEPILVQFVVRQHGQHPMDGLTPAVQATHGDDIIAVAAEEGSLPGLYEANLTLPYPGEWRWQIDAFTMTMEMPPLTVTLPASFWTSPLGQVLATIAIDAPSGNGLEPSVVGKRLFVAKGCVTCHAHPRLADHDSLNLGPDLAAYDRNPAFIRAWLRNADAFTSDRPMPMPKLELTDREIEALTAFLHESS